MARSTNNYLLWRLLYQWCCSFACGLALASGLLAANDRVFEYFLDLSMGVGFIRCDALFVVDRSGYYFQGSLPPVRTPLSHIRARLQKKTWAFRERELFDSDTYRGTRVIEMPGLKVDRFNREVWSSGKFIRFIEVRVRFWMASSICTLCLAAAMVVERRQRRAQGSSTT